VVINPAMLEGCQPLSRSGVWNAQ